MNRSFALHLVLAGALFLASERAFGSPVPHQHRIPQTIIVNGQQAEGVTVTQNGLALTFNCPNPRPYTAVDQSSSGWACFDANTGSWLLNAMSPASTNVNTKPPYDYAVPYDQYDYAYPDYTYYPEGFFGGRTGHGHGGHDGEHHR